MELVFIPVSVLQSAGKRFSAALSLYVQPELSSGAVSRAGVAVWALGMGQGHSSSALYWCSSQGCTLGIKRSGAVGMQRRAGKAS